MTLCDRFAGDNDLKIKSSGNWAVVTHVTKLSQSFQWTLHFEASDFTTYIQSENAFFAALSKEQH